MNSGDICMYAVTTICVRYRGVTAAILVTDQMQLFLV